MKSMKMANRPAVTLDAMPSEKEAPQYPWGLRVTLEKEQILKLGLGEAAMDDEVTIAAKGHVCAVHKSEVQREGYDDYQHTVEVQITHMEVEKK